MKTIMQVRSSVRTRSHLRKVALRTKLVASVLVLVLAALALISAGSTYALHTYLLQRLDDSLANYGATIANSRHATIAVPDDFYVAITSVDGVYSRNPSVGDTALKVEDLPPLVKGLDAVLAVAGKPYSVLSPSGRVRWRVLVVVADTGTVIQVAEKLSVVERVIARTIWVDVLVGTGVLIALASVGAAIVRQSLIPLLQIERTAAAIGAGDLTQRVPDPEPTGGPPMTELGRLSRALNAMLAQIEAAFTARAESEVAARLSEGLAMQSEAKMRQFVADASHELRTPLTTIRGFAELYRQIAGSGQPELARLVRRIEDEAARMGLLVEDLLLLARLDRERPLTLGPVELPVLALDAVQAAEAAQPERIITLEVRGRAEQLIAYGDEARLRQVIGNLITNALVHTPSEATVSVRVYADIPNRVVMEIADTGPGLSEQQKARVFERFYRADEARTRHTDRQATGTGLGLAIVAAIVRAHEGTVEVLSEPGGGSNFRVTLPANTTALDIRSVK